MDSVSVFSYYFHLIASYVSYFSTYYSDKSHDYEQLYMEQNKANHIIRDFINGDEEHKGYYTD